MGKILKRTARFCVGMMMVANILPFIKVYAATHGSGEYEITASVDSNADWLASFTIDGEDWVNGDTYLSSDAEYSMTFELHIPNEDERANVGIRIGGDSGEFSFQQAGDTEDWQGTHRKYTFTASYTTPNAIQHVSINPYSEDNGEPQPGPDSEAIINVDGLNEEDGRVSVWDSETEGKVNILFETLWHMKFVGDIMVNGETITVADYINYDDQKSYLEHYNEQIVSFMVEFDRAANDTYDVTVETARNENQFIGNFLWTADPAQAGGENYIGNSSLAILAVEYTLGDTTYSCDSSTGRCAAWEVANPENRLECNIYEDEGCMIPYVEFNSSDGEYDDGSLVVPAGATITMQVIPDYGYQVLNVNMADLEVSDDGVGQFTFTVPGGAAYFVADVVAMEDVLTSGTEVVTGGAINLGEEQTTFNHGTARLEVNDVDLTEEGIASFEDAAGDYSIKTYLDISLYNMTCKGAATCTGTDEDSWNERVRELNEAATITLQLEDGVDGNEIVIVHEKHDGTYEIIPTEYDAETNTLTFTTTSFSNYAIASRTITSPDTGFATSLGADAEATTEIVVFVVSVSVVGAIALRKRNTF